MGLTWDCHGSCARAATASPSIRQDLLETGWHEVPYAPATLAYYDGGFFMGLLALHVDDGLLVGDGAAFEQAAQAFRGRAPLDKWRRGQIQFTRREIRQNDEFSTEVSQHGYWQMVEPIAIDRERHKFPDALLTQEEFVQIRCLVAKLSWPARESMPELSFAVSKLQQSMSMKEGSSEISQ